MTRPRFGLPAGLLAALALLAAGCVAPPPAAPGRPALAVLIVVDGLPHRQLVDYREQLAPDGVRRFLERGRWYAQAHYGYAFTVTAPGHATIATGANPDRHGIIGNEWRDPASADREYCTADPAHRYIGHGTPGGVGTSPRNLRVETLGDALREADARSKVVAISGKDRGAILPAGRKGSAYLYMPLTGHFASTTYYMKEHPGWVQRFNAARPADAYFGREWRAVLPDAAYAASLAPGESPAPDGRLSKPLGERLDKPGPEYYGALIATPFMDELTLDFARAAVSGEALGADEAPDLLVVSLSSHDYVNHGYGAESRLSHDHLLQVDRLLQRFLRDLDAAVGADRYVAVLTSDHGFMPPPELTRAKGGEAGRVSASRLVRNVNAALEARFGEGPWVRGFSAMGLLLDRRLAAERGVDATALGEAARAALLEQPGVQAAYTRAELEGGTRAGAPFFDAVRRTWHRELSGDVQMVLAPHWMMGSARATHGSPHAYDAHVPVLFHGPRWVRAGRVDARIDMTDLAPTLAALLGVRAPSAAEGRALDLAAP